MALVGEVVSRVDRLGNNVVKPLNGSREIVLRQSVGKYHPGDFVYYNIAEQGTSKDFASPDHVLVPNEDIEKGRIIRKLPEITEEKVKEALLNYNPQGIRAVILYDSDKRLTHHIPLVIVSTCAGKVSGAVKLVHEYSESGTFRFGDFSYSGNNGLYGERMLVNGTRLNSEFNEGANWVRKHFFITIPGLSSGNTWETAHISPKTLQHCVENARLENNNVNGVRQRLQPEIN